MTEFFRTVLNMSITGAYIAAAIIILRIFMKKLPKKYSYMLWAILGIRLLCPFSFSSAVSVFNVLIPEKPEISSGQMEYIPPDIEYSYEPQVTVSVPQVNDTVNNYLPPAEPNNSVNPMQIVMGICTIVWTVGVLAMVIYTVMSYISVRKRVKGAAEHNGIFICDNIETPFVFGIIRPRIFLPENISHEDMRYIIAHEQTHIRRGDHIIKLIAIAALCIHWFNPMVWISYRLMTKDMELSCDEKALGTFDDNVKKAYANALLNISMRQNKLTLGGVLSFGESDIKSRIKGVLGAKKPKVIVTVVAVIAVIIAAVCLLTNAVKKTTEFEPIPDGMYVTDKLLYTAPQKDSYWGDDNGLTYEIKGDTITISGKTYKLSKPMEIPFTEEEWSDSFDNFEKTGWQDGEKNLGDYDNKYCFALQSDEDGGFELYLFVMDDELWYVTYGWEIYRLKLADNYTPSKAYTYISAVTDLENALKFERVDGDDPLCISIKVPNSAEEEEDFVRFSSNTVMYISPFAEIPIGIDAVDEAMIGAINDMEKSCVLTEHNGEIPCREYIIDDNGTVRWLCFVYENSDLNCGNIIKFVTTDDSFTYEKAERIVSTAHFMYYADFSDTENFNQPTEDIPEDVSDDDVTDEPAYSLPANEAPHLQTSDEFESEDFGDFKKVSHKRQVMSPDEYGGYNIIADAELVDIRFAVPKNWTSDGYGIFMMGDKKVLEQNIIYSDSCGLMTEGFLVDMVSGREIKKIEEKYGGENDPYRYYIHTSMQSYNGVYDNHYFVIQQNGYYAAFCFNDRDDFSMAIAEAILSTVTISPVYLDINLDSMQAASSIIDIGTLQSDGTVITTGEEGAAEVSFFLPDAWFTNDIPGRYYSKNMFNIESVYKAVPNQDYSALNGTNGTIPLFGREVNVIGESYAVEGGNSPYDYMVHKNVNGSECYEYVVTRGEYSAVVHFNADPSSTEIVRNAIIKSIKIEKVGLSDVQFEGIDFSAKYDSLSMMVTMSITNNSDRGFVAFDEGIEIFENGEYVPVSFFSLYAEEKSSMWIWGGEGLEYSQTMGAMAYPDFKVGKYRAVITGYFSNAPDVRSMMYAEFEIE